MATLDNNDGPAPTRPDPKPELEVKVQAPVQFRFRCRGRRFSAEVATTGRGTVVRVSADAGYVPYTAESRPLRRTLLKALTTAHDGVEMAADQRIVLKSEMTVDPPVCPERVVATAAALAITGADTLARLARLYAEPSEPA